LNEQAVRNGTLRIPIRKIKYPITLFLTMILQ